MAPSTNDFYWTFYGALTDVEYRLTVQDTVTGKTRTYHNPAGEICGEGDTASLPAGATGTAPASALVMPARPAGSTTYRGLHRLELRAATISAASHPVEPCIEDATTLCLLGGRYRVTVDWQDQHNQRSRVGGASPYAERTGFFWFFKPDNVELVVKVLDGRPVNVARSGCSTAR